MQKVILETEKFVFHGVLNDTLAGKEFLKRLPFSISCKKHEDAYCGTAANGVFEPYDLQNGCKNGDIILWNHCFVIDTGGEEHSEDYGLTMVIGHVEEYQKLAELPETIRLIVRAEN